MSHVYVKMSTVYRHPDEEIPGLLFPNPFDCRKMDSSMLGYEILDYEKVDKIPEKGYRECSSDDYVIMYDVNGLSKLYGFGKRDPEHTVDCVSSFYPMDENGKWYDNGTEYKKFNEKDFEKFCELFEKNKRLYYPTF